jgi:hypothetical protein
VEVSTPHTSTPNSCADTDFANLALQTYLHVQVGINALDDARHNDDAGHFTAAVNTIGFSSMSAIHSKYDIFVVVR